MVARARFLCLEESVLEASRRMTMSLGLVAASTNQADDRKSCKSCAGVPSGGHFIAEDRRKYKLRMKVGEREIDEKGLARGLSGRGFRLPL